MDGLGVTVSPPRNGGTAEIHGQLRLIDDHLHHIGIGGFFLGVDLGRERRMGDDQQQRDGGGHQFVAGHHVEQVAVAEAGQVAPLGRGPDTGRRI